MAIDLSRVSNKLITDLNARGFNIDLNANINQIEQTIGGNPLQDAQLKNPNYVPIAGIDATSVDKISSASSYNGVFNTPITYYQDLANKDSQLNAPIAIKFGEVALTDNRDNTKGGFEIATKDGKGTKLISNEIFNQSFEEVQKQLQGTTLENTAFANDLPKSGVYANPNNLSDKSTVAKFDYAFGTDNDIKQYLNKLAYENGSYDVNKYNIKYYNTDAQGNYIANKMKIGLDGQDGVIGYDKLKEGIRNQAKDKKLESDLYTINSDGTINFNNPNGWEQTFQNVTNNIGKTLGDGFNRLEKDNKQFSDQFKRANDDLVNNIPKTGVSMIDDSLSRIAKVEQDLVNHVTGTSVKASIPQLFIDVDNVFDFLGTASREIVQSSPLKEVPRMLNSMVLDVNIRAKQNGINKPNSQYTKDDFDKLGYSEFKSNILSNTFKDIASYFDTNSYKTTNSGFFAGTSYKTNTAIGDKLIGTAISLIPMGGTKIGSEVVEQGLKVAPSAIENTAKVVTATFDLIGEQLLKQGSKFKVGEIAVGENIAKTIIGANDTIRLGINSAKSLPVIKDAIKYSKGLNEFATAPTARIINDSIEFGFKVFNTATRAIRADPVALAKIAEVGTDSLLVATRNSASLAQLGGETVDFLGKTAYNLYKQNQVIKLLDAPNAALDSLKSDFIKDGNTNAAETVENIKLGSAALGFNPAEAQRQIANFSGLILANAGNTLIDANKSLAPTPVNKFFTQAGFALNQNAQTKLEDRQIELNKQIQATNDVTQRSQFVNEYNTNLESLKGFGVIVNSIIQTAIPMVLTAGLAKMHNSATNLETKNTYLKLIQSTVKSGSQSLTQNNVIGGLIFAGLASQTFQDAKLTSTQKLQLVMAYQSIEKMDGQFGDIWLKRASQTQVIKELAKKPLGELTLDALTQVGKSVVAKETANLDTSIMGILYRQKIASSANPAQYIANIAKINPKFTAIQLGRSFLNEGMEEAGQQVVQEVAGGNDFKTAAGNVMGAGLMGGIMGMFIGDFVNGTSELIPQAIKLGVAVKNSNNLTEALQKNTLDNFQRYVDQNLNNNLPPSMQVAVVNVSSVGSTKNGELAVYDENAFSSILIDKARDFNTRNTQTQKEEIAQTGFVTVQDPSTKNIFRFDFAKVNQQPTDFKLTDGNTISGFTTPAGDVIQVQPTEQLAITGIGGRNTNLANYTPTGKIYLIEQLATKDIFTPTPSTNLQSAIEQNFVLVGQTYDTTKKINQTIPSQLLLEYKDYAKTEIANIQSTVVETTPELQNIKQEINKFLEPNAKPVDRNKSNADILTEVLAQVPESNTPLNTNAQKTILFNQAKTILDKILNERSIIPELEKLGLEKDVDLNDILNIFDYISTQRQQDIDDYYSLKSYGRVNASNLKNNLKNEKTITNRLYSLEAAYSSILASLSPEFNSILNDFLKINKIKKNQQNLQNFYNPISYEQFKTQKSLLTDPSTTEANSNQISPNLQAVEANSITAVAPEPITTSSTNQSPAEQPSEASLRAVTETTQTNTSNTPESKAIVKSDNINNTQTFDVIKKAFNTQTFDVIKKAFDNSQTKLVNDKYYLLDNQLKANTYFDGNLFEMITDLFKQLENKDLNINDIPFASRIEYQLLSPVNSDSLYGKFTTIPSEVITYIQTNFVDPNYWNLTGLLKSSKAAKSKINNAINEIQSFYDQVGIKSNARVDYENKNTNNYSPLFLDLANIKAKLNKSEANTKSSLTNAINQSEKMEIQNDYQKLILDVLNTKNFDDAFSYLKNLKGETQMSEVDFSKLSNDLGAKFIKNDRLQEAIDKVDSGGVWAEFQINLASNFNIGNDYKVLSNPINAVLEKYAQDKLNFNPDKDGKLSNSVSKFLYDISLSEGPLKGKNPNDIFREFTENITSEILNKPYYTALSNYYNEYINFKQNLNTTTDINSFTNDDTNGEVNKTDKVVFQQYQANNRTSELVSELDNTFDAMGYLSDEQIKQTIANQKQIQAEKLQKQIQAEKVLPGTEGQTEEVLLDFSNLDSMFASLDNEIKSINNSSEGCIR